LSSGSKKSPIGLTPRALFHLLLVDEIITYKLTPVTRFHRAGHHVRFREFADSGRPESGYPVETVNMP
ncbi:MAG: hypothetical protein KKB90_13065, partial [Actinobacteria bacterium]|nr:hypothetical protein [Actinomycetota bacterium]MCG2820035.1 hypothetical protein [Actinomycetes bacterium]MBU4219869.1 hypothetical protein [Actinomycetota bacterium]MBU4358852.1 hypothetical protein [Actinomycetota bacterium]MBU4401125.1 hypothetical protein [Actinomycetota bacterium]